jgi:hypothetical protein
VEIRNRQTRKSLQDIMKMIKKDGLGKNGILRIPGILKGDLETSLKDRNLHRYELVRDVLHNVMGSEKNVNDCFMI